MLFNKNIFKVHNTKKWYYISTKFVIMKFHKWLACLSQNILPSDNIYYLQYSLTYCDNIDAGYDDDRVDDS